MAARNPPMTLFSYESAMNNNMDEEHGCDCQVRKGKIEYNAKGSDWKNSIQLKDLDEVEMHENLSINKHKYENIICIKSGLDVKFLVAETRTQMQEWYNQLTRPLRRYGWIEKEHESSSEGKKRRATNPEGMKRPNRNKATKSAYGALDKVFETSHKRRGIYEPQFSGTRTDGSENDGATASNPKEGSLYVEVGKDAEAEDGQNLPTDSPVMQVEGNNNIVIHQARGSALNFNSNPNFDLSVVVKITNQVEEVREMTNLTLTQLTRLQHETNTGLRAQNRHLQQQNRALLTQNQMLWQVFRVFADNGGHLHRVTEGSIVFIVRFDSAANLERFWQAYYSGQLEKSIDKCLITNELETQAGCHLSIQLQIQESSYRKGLEVLAITDTPLCARKNNIPPVTQHSYVNIHGLAKSKPPVPVRKESLGVITTEPEESATPDDSLYMELQKSSIVESTTSASENYKATKDTSFKENLDILLRSKSGKTSMSQMQSETITDYTHDYSTVLLDGDTNVSPVPIQSKSIYEVIIESEGMFNITGATQSLRISDSQPKLGVQPPIKSTQKKKIGQISEAFPQLPWRNGQTLKSSTETFRRHQEEESKNVNLNTADVSNGKRLYLVKVKGLNYIWIDHWDQKGPPLEEIVHPGDQVLSINGIDMEDCDSVYAYSLMRKVKEEEIRLTIRRAPHANVLLLQRTAEFKDLGIEIDGNVIKKVHPHGLFRKATRSKTTGVLSSDLVEWAITEINMQPINSTHTTEQIRELLDKAYPDVALVIQPADLIQAMKDALAQSH